MYVYYTYYVRCLYACLELSPIDAELAIKKLLRNSDKKANCMLILHLHGIFLIYCTLYRVRLIMECYEWCYDFNDI